MAEGCIEDGWAKRVIETPYSLLFPENLANHNRSRHPHETSLPLNTSYRPVYVRIPRWRGTLFLYSHSSILRHTTRLHLLCC